MWKRNLIFGITIILILSRLKQWWLSVMSLKYLNILQFLSETVFPALFFSITSVPLCRFSLPFKLTVRSHLDLHYAFMPKFTRHIDNRTCTVLLSSSTTVSPLLWSTGSVFPITQPLPFSPTSIWSLTPPLHLAEGVNEGRGRPSSPPPLLLNWMLVASIDICRQLSPLLWRASVQTYCSFVAFLSLQPQACLPRKSKRETLIINSAKVIAVTTPGFSTYTYILFPQLLQTPGGKSQLLGWGSIFTIKILKGEENHCNL